ncbi:MAG TPA: DegT/DnrJ/EryC1/StrS family aminotransferase [Thermoanaerobaculia bacterium]|nr:DegT/DnrJ/EryC1/StrS family aminotransferase [Thermoanaerobaculia bacterium]
MTIESVPFFRPSVGDGEIDQVAAVLRSGWLTTGPRVRQFEEEFAAAVGARHAVAVNSCTAALHLAVEALGLSPGGGVLIPTMTFAATGEILRYLGAVPILVDCDPVTLNMDLADAARKVADLRAGRLPDSISPDTPVAGIIPVHVGGLLMDSERMSSWARREGLWIVEDAAHAFPAASRSGPRAPWRRCGEATAAISCFSFYANKTITTGEGGMAVTEDAALAERMRLMSLHGLSRDAWDRYSGGKSWDYRIVAPGYKYNLTDIAAALGIAQLARAERMRQEREAIARRYNESFARIEEVDIPADDPNRIHSWHLYPIRLRLDRLAIDRNSFIDKLKEAGVGCSVHWRPLHLHPYYQSTFGWREEDFPVATKTWQQLISLPIFPGLREEEIEFVIGVVEDLCAKNRTPRVYISENVSKV